MGLFLVSALLPVVRCPAVMTRWAWGGGTELACHYLPCLALPVSCEKLVWEEGEGKDGDGWFSDWC